MDSWRFLLAYFFRNIVPAKRKKHTKTRLRDAQTGIASRYFFLPGLGVGVAVFFLVVLGVAVTFFVGLGVGVAFTC